MRTNTKITSVILLLAMTLPVLLMQGCGQPIAKDQGCPSDTYIANSTDIITGPADTDISLESSFGSPNIGGPQRFTPITFIVTDSAGVPRNNVCLFAYTGESNLAASPGPTWYTDATYSTVIFGTGPYSARVIVTNDAGVATVFWATATLPPANVASIIPPSTNLTKGADITGTSFIQVYSGSLSETFNVNWTVKGEPSS